MLNPAGINCLADLTNGLCLAINIHALEIVARLGSGSGLLAAPWCAWRAGNASCCFSEMLSQSHRHSTAARWVRDAVRATPCCDSSAFHCSEWLLWRPFQPKILKNQMVLLYWSWSLDQNKVTSYHLVQNCDLQQHKVVMFMIWFLFVWNQIGRCAHKTMWLQINTQYLGSG